MAAKFVGLQDLFAESAYEYAPRTGGKPWVPYVGEVVRVSRKELVEGWEKRGVYPGATGVIHSKGAQWGWWVDHGPARCCYHAHELHPTIHGDTCNCHACAAQTAAAREEAAAAEAAEGLGPEPGILAPSASDAAPSPRRGARIASAAGGTTWLEFPDLTPDLIEVLGKMVRKVWVEWARRQPNPKPSWLIPWEKLAKPDRDVDMQIGAALYERGFTDGANFAAKVNAARRCFPEAIEPEPMSEVESYGWAHQAIRPMYKANADVHLIERVMDLVASAVREAWARRRAMLYAVQVANKDA